METEILYHYCSTQTFHAIAQNRAIWLCSLRLSNDSMEGRLLASIMTSLAKRDHLPEDVINLLLAHFSVDEQIADGLGFCLSEEGDLLSQWRGYAADATGVAIGFSKAYLEALRDVRGAGNPPRFLLGRVEYERDQQEKRLELTYHKVKDLVNSGGFKFPVQNVFEIVPPEEWKEKMERFMEARKNLTMVLLPLLGDLFFLKTPAFREEREWRMVSLHMLGQGSPCLYRGLCDRIVPYRKIELQKLDKPAIREVVLGPKHRTPVSVVADLLKQHGFTDVTVRLSEATYR